VDIYFNIILQYIPKAWRFLTKVADTKIVPSRTLPTNAVLPCSIDRQCATKRKAAPRGKNWQQHRAAGSAGESQSLDLDGTIYVPSTLVCYKFILFSNLWHHVIVYWVVILNLKAVYSSRALVPTHRITRLSKTSRSIYGILPSWTPQILQM
jgi:hypothetical protein